MKSLNDFADNVTKSYATKENAQRAADKVIGGLDKGLARCGGFAIIERSDDRFAVVFVNPHHFAMLHLAQSGFGVFGITS